METLVSWVVLRTFILLLRYSIVGTTIILWNCVGYQVREARYDHHVSSRVSRVQYFYMLLPKSAIRRLFFLSCSIAVFCTLSRLFVPFGWIRDLISFGLHSFGGSCSFAFVVWAGTGSPKMRNPEPERNWKTRIRNPLIKENKLFKYVKNYCAEPLPLKNKRTSRKVFRQKFPVCWNLCNRYF